ncbi:hypothetical protein BH11ARM1_BH11ARM1_13910 [soil metagenome]
MIRQLIDPIKADLRSKPKKSEYVLAVTNNSYILAIDNFCNMSNELSDMLCCITSGIGISTRILYMTAEERVIETRRPIMVKRGSIGG